MYTSGTTGHAKGVSSTQHEILAQAFTAILPEYGLTAASRLLALYPHSSTASTNCAFGPAWILGATLVIDDVQHFTAERFLTNIERYRVTHATAVPTMLVRILRHVEEAGMTHDMSSLQRIAYGSAPIAPSVTRNLVETFGPIFMQVYGMTEVSGIVCTLRADEHDATTQTGLARLRSCGKPVPGAEVETVADDGTVCGARIRVVHRPARAPWRGGAARVSRSAAGVVQATASDRGAACAAQELGGQDCQVAAARAVLERNGPAGVDGAPD